MIKEQVSKLENIILLVTLRFYKQFGLHYLFHTARNTIGHRSIDICRCDDVMNLINLGNRSYHDVTTQKTVT